MTTRILQSEKVEKVSMNVLTVANDNVTNLHILHINNIKQEYQINIKKSQNNMIVSFLAII